MSTRSLPRRTVRALAFVLLGLLALLLVAAASLWWWSGTQGSLDWALRRFGEPAGLRVQGATGSLREGLLAQELRWESDGLQVQARGVDLAWDPRALLGRQLRVDRLRAESLDIVDERPAQAGPNAPPESLELPFPVALEEFAVGRLRWLGTTPVEARQLTGKYRYDGSQHRLEIGNVELDQGRLQGELTLGDRAPLPLQAAFKGELRAPVPGRAQPLPLRFEARAQGPLTQLAVSAQLRGDPQAFAAGRVPSADVQAVVAPWAEAPVKEAQAQVENLDLAILQPGLPQSDLAGRLQLTPQAEGTLALQAQLSNRLPGPYDRGRLPFSQIDARGDWRPGGAAVVEQFRAQVGAGSAEGQGRWDPEKGFELNAQVRALDPSLVYSEMGSEPLTGGVNVRGQGEDFELDIDLQSPGAAPAQRRSVAPAPRARLAGAMTLPALTWVSAPTAPARPAAAAPSPPGAASPTAPASAAPPAASTAPAAPAAEAPQQEFRDLLEALKLRRLIGKARWSKGELILPDVDVQTQDARLRGSLRVNPRERSGQGKLQLQAPGMNARIDGSIAARSGQGTLDLQAGDLARALRWIRTLPRIPQELIPPLQGRADVDLQWQGGWENPSVQVDVKAPQLRFDASAATNFRSDWRELLQALQVRALDARARWSDGQLSVSGLDLRTADARLRGTLQAQPGAPSGEGRLRLEAPGLAVLFDGKLAARSGGGTLEVRASELARATRWIQSLPRVPQDLIPPLEGTARLDLDWRGGWEDPQLQAQLRAPQLRLPPAAGEEGGQPLVLRDLALDLDGDLDDAQVALEATAVMQDLRARVQVEADVQRSADAWRLQLEALRLAASGIGGVPGDWRLALQEPVSVLWQPGGVLQLSPGSATLQPPGQGTQPARIAWEATQWEPGNLRTAGRIQGVPLEWVSLFTGGELLGGQLAGDLRFDGRWQLRTGGDTLDLQASVERSAGDLFVLAEGANGETLRLPAGIREAQLTLRGDGQRLVAGLQFDSERAGSIQGQVSTPLARGGPLGWELTEPAPLSGQLRASLPRLRAWSLLAPPGWRVRGSMQAQVDVGGTIDEPRLDGTVTAQDLAVRSITEGIALQDGRLRARLEGQRLVIEELLFRGPGANGGTLTATGSAGLGPSGFELRLDADLDQLRASVRNDRQLTVSGDARAVVGPQGVEVTGDLRVDRALIVLPDETAPQLSEDVVVTNLPPGVVLRPEARAAGGGLPLRLDLAIDLGQDFQVRGRGIDAGLRGQLQVSGTDIAEPQVNGEVRIVRGEFAAYGQRLNIERGILRFNGPATNPALDILAVRPRMEPAVGVQVTGRAEAPDIRLYSAAPMSEAEKLSMLVLGRSSSTGGAEAALLQRAALALLTSRGGGTGGGAGGIAGLIGLDELSVRRSDESGAALAIGKQIGEKLYASFERSLSGALGTLYVFYDITSRLTLRAETGGRTAVDLIYRFSYN
ncbi:translocation/assembly module TamB domain-containing protein [Ramlibacter rhizophilus]|uniref:Translocation and assembly module TamB C-terminal domain-containing protein n=1 Tax=Ramlibacter rhizophilus TaxID=1781167 RepID=A0A4Z0BHI3_9BURK|nr:translocation/assembly module TamB domain-containing protein [Ramlibacter rhizophilus]TFY98775.1 hypothetical protein EZ242_14765 [Ramlibacter rhizophilus]